MNLAPLLELPGASVDDDGFGPVTVDVPPESWHAAVTTARDALGCSFFDFLSAVDEGDVVRVVCHLVRLAPFGHLLLRAMLPADPPRVVTVEDVYAGAAWHERETAEMFGVVFTDPSGAPVPRPHLLLSEGFAGHPLRKSFLLVDRAVKES